MLVSGIMNETPLGQVVSIRAEKDSKVIQKMTKHEKKIRQDWFRFTQAQKGNTEIDDQRSTENLQRMLKDLFGARG